MEKYCDTFLESTLSDLKAETEYYFLIKHIFSDNIAE